MGWRRFKNRISILIGIIWGELLKLCIRLKGFGGMKPLGHKIDGKEVIIALTSYGRRIDSVLPFAIYSLFRQTVMPSKIILVLDDFERDKVDCRIRYFEKVGLTIMYDKRDLRSFKKLVPVLEHFPNDIIITVDDDVYYRKFFLEKMLKSFQENRNCIHAYTMHEVTFTTEGNLKKYHDWIDNDFVKDFPAEKAFPVGVGGILYQKTLLYADVCDVNLFKRLCPMADDIWFFFMAKLNGTMYKKIENKTRHYIFMDGLYQLTHKDASLSKENVGENKNDIQLRNVISHYHLDVKELLKI